MNEIVYGSLSFTDSEIVDGEVYRATSLLCDVLEIGTLEVELYVRDEAKQNALSSFRRNDKLVYYSSGKMIGTYYVDSIERTGKNSFSVRANDAISLLEQSDHLGGIYTGQTVSEVVRDICNITFIIQSRFSSVKLYGWLPIGTRRENLSQVLFAVGASAKTDANGTLRIEALWNGTASTIGDDRVFLGDSVKYDSGVTAVSVLEHQYIESTEEITLFEGVSTDGDIVQFTEPAHELSATGFSIIESGANWAKISSGSGKLTGKRYTHTTRDVRVPVTPGGVENVISVSDATLVSIVNSAAVASRMADYYKNLQTIHNTVIYGGEIPGNVVSVSHPFGGESYGCIKDTAIHIGSRPTSDETIAVGYRPPKPGAGEYDAHEVLIGSGEWTVPDGVTSIRAVIVGAGSGAYSGTDGSAPEKRIATENKRVLTGSVVYTKSTGISPGGMGGEPGDPGVGGKILQETFSVSPGQKIPFSCGKGGKGGIRGEGHQKGQDGGETTFFGKSSEEGSRSDAGFVDPVTQSILGATGKNGVPGGKGTGTSDEGVVPGDPVVYDGITYNCGSDNNQSLEDYGGDFQYDYGYREARSSGGFGGGAAAGANGNDGSPPETASVSSTSATAKDGAGGAGANAVKPKLPQSYGTGGGGGNGGGGGGISGGAVTENRLYKKSNESDSTLKKATLNTITASPAPGGLGSDGGDGADGCIVIFYTKPQDWVFGQLQGKDKKPFLDRLNRRLIV